MKRILFTLTILLAVAINLHANPVDLTLARTAAQKFAEAEFTIERQLPELVYTGPDEAFFVFNIGESGFVIIAADDAYRPVIGYSNQSTFDADNIPPALVDYLSGIAESINRLRRVGNAMATPMVAAEWQSLLAKGELVSRHGGRGVDHLVQTQWDQSYPYNYFCPDDPAGSHGHAIVGCLATAMAQLVAFWKDPEHGYGSHCYVHEDYGQICADFENTYYDWDHIANKVTENSPIEEIEAAALISFHCGVTIDMGYGPDGSGGASGPIPNAMHTYFDYSDAIVQLRRDDFETETWKRMVREQFDMGWPMYYGGCDDGCHAFICDGYDDKDMFHFNLGWGGSSDGWYIIDEAPYTNPADAMFNFVPSAIYGITPSAPTDFTVTPASETELRTSLQWTNPTTSLDGSPIASIEQVVVMRNNEVIRELTDMTPGQTVVIEDENIPFYSNYQYVVYAKANGRFGKHAYANHVQVGPACQWKIVMNSSNQNGWNGGYITVYDNAGQNVVTSTLVSSTPSMIRPELPLGRLSFAWTAPKDTVNNMTFNIKDSEGASLFSFTGASFELPSGVFFETNNGCGNNMDCGVVQNVVATDNGDNPILLTWDAVSGEAYGYNIYRDGVLCRLVQTGTEFLDEGAGLGGHCYQVTTLCAGGEGAFSSTSCATFGPCYPPRNLDYEFTANHKVKLKWEAPVETQGLSAYFLYRKKDDGDYHRVKLVSASAITVNDNSNLTDGDYYYQLKSYYQGTDCFSAPANIVDEPNVFELHVSITPADVDENSASLTIAPNPTRGTVVVTGVDLKEVEVYNIVGQAVATQKAEGNRMSMDLSELPSGLYFVHVVNQQGDCFVRKVVKQ